MPTRSAHCRRQRAAHQPDPVPAVYATPPMSDCLMPALVDHFARSAATFFRMWSRDAKLGNYAAILRVYFDLAVQAVCQQPALAVIQRHPGLITGCFNTQYYQRFNSLIFALTSALNLFFGTIWMAGQVRNHAKYGGISLIPRTFAFTLTNFLAHNRANSFAIRASGH